MELDLSKFTLDDFLDCAILSHGFTNFQRDYYFHIEAGGSGEYSGQYLLRFKHCYELLYQAVVKPEFIKESWDDLYTDFDKWKEAGEPEGFVWGTNWSMCYPGFTMIENSELAKKWTELLGKEMKEVEIETEVYKMKFIYHDWTLKKLNNETGLISKAFHPLKE